MMTEDQIETYFLLKFGSMEEVWMEHRNPYNSRMNDADRQLYREYQINARKKDWKDPLRKRNKLGF